MQDAVVQVGEIKYLRHAKKLIILANRFAWESAAEGTQRSYLRRRTGMQFTRVLSVRAQRISQTSPDAVLSLLAISFQPGDEPSGKIVLDFSGGGRMELAVECVEAAIEDLGGAWRTPNLPSHEGV
jgi:DUF2948 family protein